MSHGQPVIALVADEDFPVPPNEQTRQAAFLRLEPVPLHRFEQCVDPPIILGKQFLYVGRAADCISALKPPPIYVGEQIRLFPRSTIPIPLDNRLIFADVPEVVATVQVPIPTLRSPEVRVR